ncbi:MAG: MerR family transcriptional regulator [Bacteroidaceae bacterium]|nr:MerR family transcriptional regulator [Bacteroidaceae bacterium]
MAKKNIKLYYSIREVSELLNVSESLLRYWEKEFPSIHPKKVGRGIRQYSKDDIEAIRVVYHFVKERGMTLSGAREAMKREKGNPNKKTELIDRLRAIRDELQAINRELNYLE